MLAAHTHTYKRHRPKQTLLYQLVEQYYSGFLEYLTHQGKTLPHHVDREFAEFLKCGRLEHGFLRKAFVELAKSYFDIHSIP
ncbi:hypothetical protein [Alteromonas sp. D210916BOD_24]|uniref:hypothetical protein n=1 Tax=Alteromonas sp. D210916BOD_24 TaxID=3157618 RepID=UPI00399CC58E